MAERRGGAREGAGGAGPVSAERATVRLDFETERARHERLKADEREFELGIKRGEYLLREHQKTAAATALAILTQSLRSLPDNLERSLGLGPETVEQIAIEIDNALAEVALAFRAMTLE